MSTARALPTAATAHTLLVDPTGQILFRQTSDGLWGLPATVLSFDVTPYRQVAAFAKRDLGIEVAERDLLLAHVCAHKAPERAALRLVFSVGLWQGEPSRTARTQWAAPGRPPARLASWDAETLPSLLTTTPYAEIGWSPPRQAAHIGHPS